MKMYKQKNNLEVIQMLIAIDHGNFAIKTVNHSFVAGLAEHTVKPPLTMRSWSLAVSFGPSAVSV